MSEKKRETELTREERLAQQLRANLRRRKAAARKGGETGATTDRPEKDAKQS